MSYSSLAVERAIKELSKLPGVGRKSAQRMVFFLSVLFPNLSRIPGYGGFLHATEWIGHKLVQAPLLNNFCYFWRAEAEK